MLLKTRVFFNTLKMLYSNIKKDLKIMFSDKYISHKVLILNYSLVIGIELVVYRLKGKTIL